MEEEKIKDEIRKLKEKYGPRGFNPYPSKVESLVELEKNLGI